MRVVAPLELKYHVYFPEDGLVAEYVPEGMISAVVNTVGFWTRNRTTFADGKHTFPNPPRSGTGNKKGTYTIVEIATDEERINKYVCRLEDGSYPYYFDIGYVLRIFEKIGKEKIAKLKHG